MSKVVTSEDLATVYDTQRRLLARFGLLSEHASQIERIAVYSMEFPIQLKYAGSIEARRSPLHGIGVFASETIPAGALVTHYPAHAFSQREIRDGEEGQLMRTFDTPSKKFKSQLGRLCYTHGYALDGDDGEQCLLIGDPYRHTDSLLLGHMINDGGNDPFAARLPYERLIDNNGKWLKLSLLQYFVKAVTRCNCRFVVTPTEDIVSICTLRRVEAGEELLVPYGAHHWYDRAYPEWLDGNDSDVVSLSSLMPDLTTRDPEFADALLGLMLQLQ